MKLSKQMQFALIGMVLFLGSRAFSQELLLRNIQVINPDKETIATRSVHIKEGKIYQILDKPPENFTGKSYDLEGKYLLPGFVDMHTHAWGNVAPDGERELLHTEESAKRMLYCGVTSFLDLFSEENGIISLRDRQRKSGLLGADIFCSGPILTCTGGHGTEYGVPTRVVNNPQEAAKEITELAKKNPDVIKLVYEHGPNRMPSMNRATMKAVIKEAHKHGIKVVSHIATWSDISHCVEAGTDAVTHTPAGAASADVIKMMAQKGTFTIPTLGVMSELYLMSKSLKILDNQLLTDVVSKVIIDDYRHTDIFKKAPKELLNHLESMQTHMSASIKTMEKNGIPIMAGSDSGNPGIFQGYSIHREMALLVKAGLSNYEALAAATTIPGTFLQQAYGVEVSNMANLLVLDKNPLESIQNTESINMVIQHGKMIDRKSLINKAP